MKKKDNRRLKELRKALNMTQERFGAVLGLKKNTISQIENGTNNLTDATVRSICREFNVNEEWLRTGEGELFREDDSEDIGEYMRKHGATDLEIKIMKKYFGLSENVRKELVELFLEIRDQLKV